MAAQFILFDFWISLFACVTCFIVAVASFHSYNNSGRVRQSHFGFSFLLLSVSLLLGTIVNGELRYPRFFGLANLYLPVDVLGGWLVLFAAAFLFFGILTLYLTLEDIDGHTATLLLMHTVLATLLLAQYRFIAVYAELAILLACIAVRFYRNWRKDANVTSSCIFAGFAFTCSAHAALVLAYAFPEAMPWYYVGNAIAILFVFTGTAYVYVQRKPRAQP